MARRNYFRATMTSNRGDIKIITAASRYELDMKIANQKRIWEEKDKRDQAKKNREEMKALAAKQTDIDAQVMQNYENIIKKISVQNYKKYYKSLIDNEEYKKFSTELIEPNKKKIYEELKVPSESFFEKINKKKYEKRIAMEEEAERIFKERKEEYDRELAREKELYEKEKERFYKNQTNKNNDIERKKKEFENGNIQEIEDYCSYVLEKSKWPFGFVIDYEVQYLNKNRTLIVSYYLPNEDNIPRTVQHKYVASRNEIDEVKLNDKNFSKFYNDIIYMSCLKTIKELFSSDDYNYIENIVYNGWIKYIDKTNGKETESCVLTVEVEKEKFSEISIENVDYKACIKGLKGIFAPNILNITPVVPYLNINREDSRFIESKEVSNIALDGFNLATMPWEDFEYFVRELFDKMFNVNGGEVKVTQASHDGGVDAIAFDDDPIRGGKFVIQAKRYNNVVPVSAVRDLYGTMIHEGATKGILVTTSFYGKEAYDFSKDKPITLIDGSALLGLLNKYGYSNLTIKIDKNNKRDDY